MEILQRLSDRGATVLVASHDITVVERMGKRVVTLEEGRVVSDERPGPTPNLVAVGAAVGEADDPEEAILSRLPQPNVAEEEA